MHDEPFLHAIATRAGLLLADCRRVPRTRRADGGTDRLGRVARRHARLAGPAPLCCYAAVRLTPGCPQPVDATARPNTSDGFIQFSVCRGRVLSLLATALR